MKWCSSTIRAALHVHKIVKQKPKCFLDPVKVDPMFSNYWSNYYGVFTQSTAFRAKSAEHFTFNLCVLQKHFKSLFGYIYQVFRQRFEKLLIIQLFLEEHNITYMIPQLGLYKTQQIHTNVEFKINEKHKIKSIVLI
ncbi:Hypothetical_protein [Hexamita inflata]|uniref:Hypothetical_protein n=1 Tax=Hexamita inflata TaxID=28002 RepID=A0AA86PQ91_9EUKA|nr:Hypothetical protein HINF_LOCUS30383 [Hexamita inflata]CAI9942741.1 Hypothetical protein HINF_LOCUS30386 [Hexamita inflata]